MTTPTFAYFIAAISLPTFLCVTGEAAISSRVAPDPGVPSLQSGSAFLRPPSKRLFKSPLYYHRARVAGYTSNPDDRDAHIPHGGFVLTSKDAPPLQAFHSKWRGKGLHPTMKFTSDGLEPNMDPHRSPYPLKYSGAHALSNIPKFFKDLKTRLDILEDVDGDLVDETRSIRSLNENLRPNQSSCYLLKLFCNRAEHRG